jgi:hypothetical protein
MELSIAGITLPVFLIVAGCVTRPTVSYRDNVAPILDAKCVECHLPPAGAGYVKTRLSMEDYESLMDGTLYGPVVIPGDSRHSILNMLVEGRLDPTMRTPHPLSREEIRTLRLWVDQGARNN